MQSKTAVQDPLPSSDACIHAFVRSRPASSLHAMSRLQRRAVAFAIAPHAVQDRCLGPDACIHAFALTPSARDALVMRHVTLPRCPRPSWAATIYAVSRSRFARIRPAKVDPGIRFNEPGMQRRRGRVSPGVQDGLGLELLTLDKSTVATSASVFSLMWSASRGNRRTRRSRRGQNIRPCRWAAYLSLKLTHADQEPFCGGLSAMPAVGDLLPSDRVTLKLSSPEET